MRTYTHKSDPGDNAGCFPPAFVVQSPCVNYIFPFKLSERGIGEAVRGGGNEKSPAPRVEKSLERMDSSIDQSRDGTRMHRDFSHRFHDHQSLISSWRECRPVRRFCVKLSCTRATVRGDEARTRKTVEKNLREISRA